MTMRCPGVQAPWGWERIPMSLAVSAAASSRITSSCYATHNEEPIAAVRFPGHGLVAQMRIKSVAIGRSFRPDPLFRATCQDQQVTFP